MENDVQSIINKIINGMCSNKELCSYLESPLVLIKANAILEIINSKNSEIDIIHGIYNLSKKIDHEPKVIGVWNTGHFAMAALKILDTDESSLLFEKSFNSIDRLKQKDIEDLIENLKKTPILEIW